MTYVPCPKVNKEVIFSCIYNLVLVHNDEITEAKYGERIWPKTKHVDTGFEPNFCQFFIWSARYQTPQRNINKQLWMYDYISSQACFAVWVRYTVCFN